MPCISKCWIFYRNRTILRKLNVMNPFIFQTTLLWPLVIPSPPPLLRHPPTSWFKVDLASNQASSIISSLAWPGQQSSSPNDCTVHRGPPPPARHWKTPFVRLDKWRPCWKCGNYTWVWGFQTNRDSPLVQSRCSRDSNTAQWWTECESRSISQSVSLLKTIIVQSRA